MKVEVVWISETGCQRRTVEVPEGSTASDVLFRSRIIFKERSSLSVFGVKAWPGLIMHEGDRLEVAGPLQCDPKAARARRALEQGDIRVVTCGRHGGKRAPRTEKRPQQQGV
ncbi:MAG: RnfH family protein [Sutterella sp.]|nr:RnfH family protein [Sutterella sp.]